MSKPRWGIRRETANPAGVERAAGAEDLRFLGSPPVQIRPEFTPISEEEGI